ncbi:MAG: hypothetical protein EPN93_03830 [Spirochaetes bacterium]|nr:MAG: hypothetical protein EPN93_03830 [Spirochaetota bacterium]
MKTIKHVLLIMLVLCGVTLSQVFAEEKEAGKGFAGKEYDLGISLGIWFPGNINIDSDLVAVDADKSSGLLVRAFADAYVAPKFAVGAYGNYSKATLKAGGLESDATFYEFGVAMKPRFLLSPTVALKPGLNIGYRNSTRETIAGLDAADADLSADGMGLNLSVELQIMIEGGYIFHIDGGFLSQPVGGTDDADVAWAPIMYLAAGITF